MAKKLFLHVCCGPCAIMPILRLRDEGYGITAWFMNPNIQPLAEYLRRREAAEICAAKLGIEILFDDASWNLADWLKIDQKSYANRLKLCVPVLGAGAILGIGNALGKIDYNVI